MNLWIVFWVAFAAFVVFLLVSRVRALFTPEWYSNVHKLLYITVGCTLVLFIVNLAMVKTGNVPPDLTVWLYHATLWSIPFVAVVRLVQWIVLNRQNATR